METIEEIRSSSNLVTKIIVVDNGSEDLTSVKARSQGAVVIHEPLRGKGFAFRRGLTEIDQDCSLVFLVDGDFTYGINQLNLAAEKINVFGYDLVVGARVENEKSSSYRFGHKFGNKLLTQVHNFMFGMKITDSLSGWRLMSRGFALSFSAGASRFELETELNAHAYHLRSAVIELPVLYRDRPQNSFSKLKTYSDGFKILRRNANLWRSERPFIAYSFLSLPWFLSSVALLWRVLTGYLDTGLVPKFPSLIVSIGLFIIGANLWIAGIILERTNLQRVALGRYIYLQESHRSRKLDLAKSEKRNLRNRKKAEWR